MPEPACAMQPPVPDGLVSAPRPPRVGARVLAWRLPAIETYPTVVAFAQTRFGKVVLFIVFATLMKLSARGLWIDAGDLWLWMTIGAAAVSFAGRHRLLALLVCTTAFLVRDPDWFDFTAASLTAGREYLPWASPFHIGYLRAYTLTACAALAAMALHLARRYRDRPLGRRPVLAQHVLYLCLLGLATSHLMHGIPQVLLWCGMAIFSAYFWFLAYALTDQSRPRPVPVLLQFATFNPFAWASFAPFGKGAATWRSVEAGTPEDLAVTQLKALKLLAWAFGLKVLLWSFRQIVYGKLGVPHIDIAFGQFLRGGAVPAPYGFLGAIANFPERLLAVAIGGHIIVATARLAGFRLLRNTCRPLSSRSIAEFWNRYLFYFKEMLVHVYFYPVFVRCFKRHPRLRVAFATFMAAGVGNYFFHLIMATDTIARSGLIEALWRSQTYAAYCAMLVAGIVLSQLRPRRPDAGAGWWRRQFAPSMGVAVFFCVLSFFDRPSSPYSLAQHFRFLFMILGIDRWI